MSLLFVLPNVARATPRPHRPSERAAYPAEVVRLPVTLHFVQRDGHAHGLDQAARWIAEADRALAPHGVVLDVRRVERLPEELAVGSSSKARRALARRAVHDGTIHVFIVDRLERGPTRKTETRGIYWRYVGLRPALRGREYVAVTARAPASTLVHEIGHLLGLGHARSRENVMCSCDRGRGPSFSADQGQRLRVAATRRAATPPAVARRSR